MKEELEKQIVEKYPVMFQDYGGDMRKTCMHWGFECGDGWYNIINTLCQDVEMIIGEKDIKVIADQVKEKFGGLRFYYHIEYTPSFFSTMCTNIRNFCYHHMWGGIYNKMRSFRKKFFRSTIEKISDAISDIEGKSYKTCESCGAPGKRTGGSWIKTLCEKCDTSKK